MQEKALLADTAVSARVVSTAISKAKNIWRKSISSGQYIIHDQHSEIISAAAVYHQRGIAVYRQQ